MNSAFRISALPMQAPRWTQAESGLLEWLSKGYHGEMDYMAKHGGAANSFRGHR